MREYDIASDRWVFRADMPASAAHTIHPGWVVAGGRIYTFGGGYRSGNAWAPSDCAQRYDPSRDVWDQLPPLADGKIGVAVTALDGKIYVVGGESVRGSWQSGGNNLSGDVEVYDTGDVRPQ